MNRITDPLTRLGSPGVHEVQDRGQQKGYVLLLEAVALEGSVALQKSPSQHEHLLVALHTCALESENTVWGHVAYAPFNELGSRVWLAVGMLFSSLWRPLNTKEKSASEFKDERMSRVKFASSSLGV